MLSATITDFINEDVRQGGAIRSIPGRDGVRLPQLTASRVSIPGRRTQTHPFGSPELTRQTSDFGEARRLKLVGPNPREEVRAQTQGPES